MNTPRRRCPVCWRHVGRTIHGLIEGHWDSLGIETCPAIGEPYRITLAVRLPTSSWRRAHRNLQEAA